MPTRSLLKGSFGFEPARVLLAAVATLLGAAGTSLAAADAAPRPNILLVLADNWAWPDARVCGNPLVKTPAFDRLAGEGVLFRNAFCHAPSCAPARAALLTGRPIHQLEDGANLWGHLPARFQVYPDLLEAAGYVVGYAGKGWSPGRIEEAGRTRNPAGPQFESFARFLSELPADRPFCLWYGDLHPSRQKMVWGSGVAAGMRPEQVVVPPYLPDTAEVRSNILDYYLAVEKFDQAVNEILGQLAASGRAGNTLLVVAGDNGWQMPRGLANLYDSGTRVPMVVRWPLVIRGGRVSDEFADFLDLAPTFLEAAGVPKPAEMLGRSLLGLLRGDTVPGREQVFLERERHANVRRGDLGYPARGVRTREFLYIRNDHPERWPAGDPEFYHAVGPFGDVDQSPTKDLILARREDPAIAPYFALSFGKRPAEELYDLAQDPQQVQNVAARPEYAAAKARLRARLDEWLQATGDPRAAQSDPDRFDRFPYYAPAWKPGRGERPSVKPGSSGAP